MDTNTKMRICNLILDVRGSFKLVAQVKIPEPDRIFDTTAITYDGHIYAYKGIDGNLVSYRYEQLRLVEAEPITDDDLQGLERDIKAKRRAEQRWAAACRNEPCASRYFNDDE